MADIQDETAVPATCPPCGRASWNATVNPGETCLPCKSADRLSLPQAPTPTQGAPTTPRALDFDQPERGAR